MASRPTIVMVPGAWQLPTGYMPFVNLLKQSGFDADCVDMPSTGGTQLPLPGLPEDISAVRAVIQPLVDAGKEVVLLTHSSGGVSGSGAVKGLDVKTRKEAGLPGGVIRIIYMAAFVIPKGKNLLGMLGGKPLPWMIIEDGRVTIPVDMRAEIGFSDLSPEEQKKWSKEFSHTSAVLFEGSSEYEPWSNDIPCAYIFTIDDGALPYPLQQQLAAQLGPNAPTATLKANHSPFLSVPKELLAAVEKLVCV